MTNPPCTTVPMLENSSPHIEAAKIRPAAVMTPPVAEAPRPAEYGWFAYAPMSGRPLPDGRPGYKLLTGFPGDTFDQLVSAALAEGYGPMGPPVLIATSDGVMVAQAVTWQGPWTGMPEEIG